LRASCDDLILINDEVHKTLNDTQRTTARGGFVMHSGTPVVDSHIFKLVPWLSLIVRLESILTIFGLQPTRLWHKVSIRASASMHARSKHRGHQPPKSKPIGSWCQLSSVEATLIRHETGAVFMLCRVYLRNGAFSLRSAFRPVALRQTGWCGGLFVVADDVPHQQQIKEMLMSGQHGNHPTLKASDIFCLGPDGALHLSDEEVENGSVQDFAVVITTKRMCSGYTAS
jgi:hypothetical protein